MKQPYSCWLKVPDGVGWDRKGSPKPNLHVCGENDIRRAVYNRKESIEERGLDEEERTQKILRRKPKKRVLNSFEEERNRYIRANLSK